MQILKSCGCPLCIAVMSILGCKHAAKMHSFLLEHGHNYDNWSTEDYLIHFIEEKEHFFPYVREISFWTWFQLCNDHVVFEKELELFGKIISVKRFKKHAEIEDQYAELIATKHPELLEGY